MNPNKHIRLAIINAVEAASGWPAFDESVPPDLAPQPMEYVIVNGTTKNRFADNKSGHEWLCSTQIEIVSIQEKGYASTAVVDDAEEKILKAMPKLQIPGFRVKFTRLLDSRPLNIEVPGQKTIRTVMVYEQWIGGETPAVT